MNRPLLICLSSLAIAATACASSKNLLEEGDFESGRDEPTGFAWRGFAGAQSVTPNRFEIKSEKGNRFVRITVPFETARAIAWVELREPIPISPKWQSLEVGARFRVRDYLQGSEAWQGVKIFVTFFDAEGKQIGAEAPAVSIKQDVSSWKSEKGEVKIPEGAENFLVKAGFIGSSGVVDIDDLTIVPKD